MFESIKLGQIVSISKGRKHNLLEYKTESSKRYIQIDDLRNNLNLKYTDDKKGILVTDDDVIIAWDGANAGTVGYNLNGLIGSTLAVLRNNNPKEYNPQYLALFLQSKCSYLRARTTGATIPHLHRKTLESLKIPKISIDNQVKIANLLTQVEELIAKRKESIELLDEMLKSTFLDMFGDPINNPHEFEEIQLQDVCLAKGEYGSGASAIEYDLSLPRYLRITDINEDGSLSNDKKAPDEVESKYFLEYGDMLFARTGATVGKTYLHTSDELLQFAGYLIRFKPDFELINPYYLFHFTQSGYYKYWVSKKQRVAGQPNINAKEYGTLKLLKPPKPLQDKFATIVQQVETTKAHYQDSLDELNELFGSLSQRAFRGELELDKINMPVSIKVADAKALDAPSSSGAVDLKEILDVPVFMRKQMDEEEVTTATYTDSSNNPVYDEDFLWMILQQSDDEINYESIHDKLSKFSFLNSPNYDQVQKDIFSLLKQTKLEQKFDIEKKKIMLSKVL